MTSELSNKIEHESTECDSDKNIEIYKTISSSLSSDINYLKNNIEDIKSLAKKIKVTASTWV